jgi:WD40 repeat protein
MMPNGRQAVSASWDLSLKLWELVNNQVIHTFLGHSDVVYAVGVASAGNMIVSGAWDCTLRVWTVPPPASGNG